MPNSLKLIVNFKTTEEQDNFIKELKSSTIGYITFNDYSFIRMLDR